MWEKNSSVSSSLSWASLVVFIVSRGLCVVGSVGARVLFGVVSLVGCGCLLVTKSLSMEAHVKPYVVCEIVVVAVLLHLVVGGSLCRLPSFWLVARVSGTLSPWKISLGSILH